MNAPAGHHPNRRVSINCDMAEGFGAYDIGADEPLLAIITDANAACGFHAGDPLVMTRFAARAKAASVGLGAHPGFPDLQGFGRRRMAMTHDEIKAMVIYQIGALQAVARAAGTTVTHVKPHGALSNMAAADPVYADAIAEAILATDPGLIYVVHFGSQMHRSAMKFGVPFAREGYADRRYDNDGNLAPRSMAAAVISDPADAAEQALRMVRDGTVATVGGDILDVEIDTICVHGDQPGAVPVAAAVRAALEAEGYTVGALQRDRFTLPAARQPRNQSAALT